MRVQSTLAVLLLVFSFYQLAESKPALSDLLSPTDSLSVALKALWKSLKKLTSTVETILDTVIDNASGGSDAALAALNALEAAGIKTVNDTGKTLNSTIAYITALRDGLLLAANSTATVEEDPDYKNSPDILALKTLTKGIADSIKAADAVLSSALLGGQASVVAALKTFADSLTAISKAALGVLEEGAIIDTSISDAGVTILTNLGKLSISVSGIITFIKEVIADLNL